ncbi:hypothetical protein DKW60_10400 [Leucothrix pacifica]|uniref:Uncharacterized protein n=1 Tax=Leucothrix pacifica TaxID=1247513 RepID=A0A317CFX8_9GAMM|nr:hypothetical protein DKW60_10400 [Leucothrix pacifica]
MLGSQRVSHYLNYLSEHSLLTNDQRPTTNDQRPTTNYQLPTTNYQLPTTKCKAKHPNNQ